jgi:ubiquinone/menaquinone biosynthesis C-methylase UbiE
MDARLQRRVQRYGWDKAEAHYERYWADQLEPAQSRLLGLAQIKPGDRVLDVACGTGLVTFRAADAVGPQGAVLGTDLSDAMVRHLSEEAHRRGLDHVTAVRADAEDLEVPSASCDVALCALGLMYVGDPVAALREMRRALRHQGRAVAAVWGARAQCGWAEIFPIVERRVASDVCPLFFQLGGGNALRYAFDAAGFGDLEVERMTTVLAYDSADAACGAAFAGGPVALAYSRFDAPTRDSAHAEYLESIAPYRHGAGYAIPGEFVIARGMKIEGPGTG